MENNNKYYTHRKIYFSVSGYIKFKVSSFENKRTSVVIYRRICRLWICGKEIVQGFGGEETTKEFRKEERVLAKIMLLSHRVLGSKALHGS